MSLRCGNIATCPAVLGTRRGLSMWTTMVPLYYLIVLLLYLLHWFWFLSPYSYKNDMVSIRRPRFHILTIFIYPNPTKMIYGVNSQDSSYDIPLFLHKDYIMYIHSPPLSISLFNDTMSNSQDTSCPKSRVRVLIWVTLLMGK